MKQPHRTHNRRCRVAVAVTAVAAAGALTVYATCFAIYTTPCTVAGSLACAEPNLPDGCADRCYWNTTTIHKIAGALQAHNTLTGQQAVSGKTGRVTGIIGNVGTWRHEEWIPSPIWGCGPLDSMDGVKTWNCQHDNLDPEADDCQGDW